MPPTGRAGVVVAEPSCSSHIPWHARPSRRICRCRCQVQRRETLIGSMFTCKRILRDGNEKYFVGTLFYQSWRFLVDETKRGFGCRGRLCDQRAIHQKARQKLGRVKEHELLLARASVAVIPRSTWLSPILECGRILPSWKSEANKDGTVTRVA